MCPELWIALMVFNLTLASDIMPMFDNDFIGYPMTNIKKKYQMQPQQNLTKFPGNHIFILDDENLKHVCQFRRDPSKITDLSRLSLSSSSLKSQLFVFKVNLLKMSYLLRLFQFLPIFPTQLNLIVFHSAVKIGPTSYGNDHRYLHAKNDTPCGS